MKAQHETAIIFILVFMLISFSGCLPRYGIGNGGGEPIYFTKPLYQDSAVITNYAGGKYCHSIDSAYSKNESNYFGEIYFYQTYTKKYFDLSYGLYGYTGSYYVSKIAQYKGQKSYYGGGISSEFNINIPLRLVELRLLGIRGTLQYEGGPFSGFRNIASARGLIDNENVGNYVYNLSYSSEYVFKLKYGSFGLYASEGLTKNFDDESGFFTTTSSIHYTLKNVTAYIQYTHIIWGIGYEYSLGLNYRIR